MKKLDTSELGPIKLGTAPRVLKVSALGARIEGRHVHFEHPDNFDAIEWQGVRFVKERS